LDRTVDVFTLTLLKTFFPLCTRFVLLVKPKLNRYKPALAEFSLTEVGSYKIFEKHIDKEENRGLILYLDNKLEATEIHMEKISMRTYL
jgi:hypothetical protein